MPECKFNEFIHKPFRDDDEQDFGVNKKVSYWNWFAGCGGWDIVGFWMKYSNVDFITALGELKEMEYGRPNLDDSRGC